MLAAVCLLTGQSLADYEYEMDDFLKREYSLTKPYQAGLGASWDLLGTTMVTTEYVRLTPDLQSRHGAVWNRVPCYLTDWELHVHFKIHGAGKKDLNGDGMALWYTKERMQMGPVFGNMNLFTGLGVFVDTYPNKKNQDKKPNPATQKLFPYVSVMLGNGTLAYDHDRDGLSTEIGGCAAQVRNVDHNSFLLIRYSQNQLKVMVDVEGKREWKNCVDVSGLRLPKGYFFGASSVTGDLSDNHDLMSMKLYQLKTVKRTQEGQEEEEVSIPSIDNMEQFKVDVQVEEEGMGGVQFFFTIVFSIMGVLVLAVVAGVMYVRWKENRRKRFY